MPEGTKVESTYQALRKKGYGAGKSARIAQAQTGESLSTGRPPNRLTAANEIVPDPGDDLFHPDMTTPSSQRVTPTPGNKVLRELREARIKRESGETPAVDEPENYRPAQRS
jgi:hypothetical protein